MQHHWPLMKNNITNDDKNVLIDFLREDNILTQSKNVIEFEKEWSQWLGVKYSVFVNSGASANLITMAALKHIYGTGEIIVPTLTWVSDIASVIHLGFTPVFVDINPNTLGMNEEEVLNKISDKTKAVFITHVLGFNALSSKLIQRLKEKSIPLIEDVCESHGATFENEKLGAIGLASNFSFYYAHHMSSIEGGMVCTNDFRLYNILKMLRSHGLVREAMSNEIKAEYKNEFPELHEEFIFAYPGFNVRNTELGAVIARNQLKRLDENNRLRIRNFQLFIKNLSAELYQTEFRLEGSVNYAFVLILKNPDNELFNKVIEVLDSNNIEYRRGTAGGGNQLRQPYLKNIISENEYLKYPKVEHVHHFGLYIGNYPELEESQILELCRKLNEFRGTVLQF